MIEWLDDLMRVDLSYFLRYICNLVNLFLKMKSTAFFLICMELSLQKTVKTYIREYNNRVQYTETGVHIEHFYKCKR